MKLIQNMLVQTLRIVYPYLLTAEALICSFIPLLTASNYPVFFRLRLLTLEVWFFLKASFGLLLRRRFTAEQFLGYTMRFPNYLEFVLLFIEIWGIQEYRLRTRRNQLTIVDCGSSWGMSVLYFKHLYPKSRIVAIEANEKTAKYLKGNVKQNNLDGITIRTGFVSGKQGRHAFYTNNDESGWSVSDTGASDFVTGKSGFTKTTLISIPLSDLLRDKVDVVKLDIEGMEGEAVYCARNQLRRVAEVLIEHHPGMNQQHNGFELIRRILENAGMTVSYVNTKALVSTKSSLRMIRAIRI